MVPVTLVPVGMSQCLTTTTAAVPQNGASLSHTELTLVTVMSVLFVVFVVLAVTMIVGSAYTKYRDHKKNKCRHRESQNTDLKSLL